MVAKSRHLLHNAYNIRLKKEIYMNYGESIYARPIGAITTEPREDYKPKTPYRRGEASPFPRQAPMSQPEQQSIINKPAITSPKADVDKQLSSSYTEGSYADRVIAAVKDGHQTTTDIVSITGLPRKAAVKTISRLVANGRLQNLPVPVGVPNRDRYVALCNKPVVTDAGAISDMADESPLADTASHVSPSHKVSPVAKLQLLINEQDNIKERFIAIHDQLETLKKQFDAIFDVLPDLLPDLRGAIEAVETARKSQAVLASIVKTVRSLDSD
jgi:hypothetical protein